MENEHQPDWDPNVELEGKDQRIEYDRMRQGCPVAHSDFFGWSLFRHEDVMRALLDHETFSNAVSQHLSVPNGMDPPEHTPFRKIIEPYFSPERMRVFEPVCGVLVKELLQDRLKSGIIEFIEELALPFAVRVQCAFLGWPKSLHDRLIAWVQRSQRATLARDRQALSAIAREFEEIVDGVIDERRGRNAAPDEDLTSSLMNERVHGRLLTNEELASILRNWTAGEIGTISAAVGIVAAHLAEDPGLQEKIRADRSLLLYAIDEILRIHGPLVTNRRVTKCPVEMGGKRIGAGERISINWVSANRDEKVFPEADKFRFGRDQSKNLLYGAGIHVCPGAPLASLEMRVFLEQLLLATRFISFSAKKVVPAVYPASGYSELHLEIAKSVN
jgi:hypothetical protein